GGGGMALGMAMIIEEELDRYHLATPPYYDTGGRLGSASILVWGTDEQKSHFLPLILRGAIRTWQLLSEPESGSDLASVSTSAVREGDEYVINGSKIFVGSNHGAEYSWMIVRTDPNGERHKNLSWFMMPMDLPGITIDPMDLLLVGGERGAASGVKNTVFFDNVRVPAFNLIGGENNGWEVAGTHLEIEHGLLRSAVRADEMLDRVMAYARESKRNGRPLTDDPEVRESLVDFYIQSQVTRLLHFRNFAYRADGTQLTYEGPQAYLHQKRSALSKARAVLEIMGPRALVSDPEWAVADGHIEVHQRASIVEQRPGGTAEIQRVIIARRLGIGRAQRETPGQLPSSQGGK
ncbi:MAG: acyl-CoA dehydrogenase family protein, partial [Chloroflexi bacterium]|nr:acyl-CoA dehydrogenase family protein [Chloroflexota bacterium]